MNECKLVPIDPTDEMINAVNQVMFRGGTYTQMYKAAIGAAPELPSGAGSDSEKGSKALVRQLVAALEGVVRVADRKTIEFDAARTALANAKSQLVTPNALKSPNSGHGHVYPRPDGVKARCGGPGVCAYCSIDAKHKADQEAK